MKKLMLSALVALIAIATQAASVKWYVQNLDQCGVTPAAKVTSGDAHYQLLLCYSADTTVSATFDGKSVNMNGDTLISTQSIGGSGGLSSMGKAITSDYAAGSYYYVALFNASTDVSATAYTHYAVSSLITGNPVAVAPDVATPLKWTTTVAGPTWTAAAPEPTSGLLLLLGMAGLALMRKRT